MSSAFKWHSCSKEDFPFKRQKVPRACICCRTKKMRCDGARPCARCEKTSTLCEYDEKITQSRRQSSQPAVQTLSSSIPNLHEEERRLSTSSDKHSEANCQCDIYQRRIHDLEAQLHVLKQERDRNIVKTETCLEDGKKQTQSAGQEKSASSRTNLLEPLEMPSGSEAEPVTIMSPTSNISFANDLYAYIRSHPPSVRANQARAYISDTRLPPLMFDFYNLSSQPHTIWMAFVTFMRQWSQKQQQQHHGPSNTKNEHISKLPVPDNLGCEMLKLHTCHNYLYSAFIDTSNATNKQTASNWKSKLSEKPFLKTQSAASGCDETMLVYAIFANVFLCASQSLSISAPDIAELSRQCSEVYYHQAYRIFTTNVFPASHPAHPAEPIMEQLSILAKTSVLLTHYQCATLSEEQAFLTFKIGLTFAERLGLHKLSTHKISQQQFTQFYNAEVDDARRLWITADKVNTEEYERLCNLWKVISGWDVWFAIYLDRPPMVDDMPRDIPKILPPSKRIEPRDWAMQVVNVYIDSMRTILRSPSSGSCAQLKSKLDKLKAWSSSFMAKQRKGVERSTNESSIHLPASILSLYHDILTIQLYRSKALPALKFFGDAAGWVPSKQKPNSGSKRRMDTEPESPKPVTIDEAGKKDQSKEDLVAKKVVDTTLNHIEVTETSGPSETKVAAACCTVAARNIVETATRIISTDRHCAGAPVVLYPLCLAGTVLIWQYHQRSRSSHLGKHGRSEGTEQDTSGLLVLDDGEFTRVLSSFKQLTRDISKSFPVAEKVLNVLNEMLGTNTVIDLSSDPTSIADAPSNELSYMVNQQTHQQQQMRHQMNMMLQPEWIPEFQPDGIIDMHPSLIQDPLFSNQRHSIGSFPPPNYTHMDVLNFSGRREMDREAIGKLDRDYRDSVAATNAYTNQSAHMLVLSSQLPMNFAMNQTMYDEQISNFSNKKSPTTARETPDFTTTTKTPLRTPATPKANQQWSRQMWLQHQRQQVNGQFSFDVYNSQLVAEKNNSKKQRVESSYDDIPDNNGESIMKNEFATFTEMTAADQPVDFGVYPSELNPFLMSDSPMNHQHTHATSSDPAGLTLQHNNNAYSQRAQHLTHQRSVSQDTPPTPHPYITNAAMASTPHTKLPLPAPKQTHVIQKSWPTTTSSREFLARFNVVETLHPAHPIASSDVSYMGTNLVDPTTMSVVPPPSSSTQQQGLTDQHQEMVLSTF